MINDDNNIELLVKDLLKNPSERDVQTKIGPSSIGDPCDFCVANKLLGHKQRQSPYYLGARIGTAIHGLLEQEANNADTRNYRFAILDGGFREEKIDIFYLEGYGQIKGSVDLYVENRIIDYKTTSKAKLAGYKLDGIPEQYRIQQSLYGFGVKQSGRSIERISLAFICRDGQTDKDLWFYHFDYDESIAVKALERLENIWKFLQAGGVPNALESDPHCYYCNAVLHRM